MSGTWRAGTIWSKAAALFRRRLERDLDEELRFHLERRAEHYGAGGLPAEEARQAAGQAFGRFYALKEQCREAWRFAPLESLAQDVRIAWRGLRQQPLFTGAAVVSLAIGIGANAAIFSLVNRVLLLPLPYPEPDACSGSPGLSKGSARGIAGAQPQHGGRRRQRCAGAQPHRPGRGGAAHRHRCLREPVRRPGPRRRAWARLPGRRRPSRARPLVVLGHALWQARFGSDPSILGRTSTLDGVDRQWWGVMPPGFDFPTPSVQLFVPLRIDPTQPRTMGYGWMPLVARLRPGAEVAQAHDELAAGRTQSAACSLARAELERRGGRDPLRTTWCATSASARRPAAPWASSC